MKRAGVVSLVVLLFGGGSPSVPTGAAGVGSGTSAVIMRSPRMLWAAVDSKEVLREYLDDGSVTVTEKDVCKAARIGDYYAVIAGIASSTNGFDALGILTSLYRHGETLDELVRSAEGAVPSVLEDLLTSVESINPRVFDQTYNNQPALQIAFLGAESHQPQTRVVEFLAVRDNGRICVVPRMMTCPADSRTCNYFLGMSDKIQRSVKEDPGLLRTVGSQQVERLVRLEYEDRPDVVGGPITMINYTPSGLGEVRGGACQKQ